MAEAKKKGGSGEKTPMRELLVDKLVINIGTGGDDNVQNNAKKLLELIAKRKPSNAYSKKRNPAFKISKGQKIGAFVTVRGDDIAPLAQRLFESVDNKVRESAVSENSVSFGIREYIDISGVKYDPKIGMLGMNVNLSFRRRGNRVALRKRKRAVLPESHRVVSRDEIKDYLKSHYKVEVAEA